MASKKAKQDATAITHWVQALRANSAARHLKHWQEWFVSKGIPTELRQTVDGPTLFRGMTDKEFAIFEGIV